MPQLNPLPWFPILVFSWLVFTTIMPAKVLVHKFPNEPMFLGKLTPQTESWNWLWH